MFIIIRYKRKENERKERKTSTDTLGFERLVFRTYVEMYTNLYTTCKQTERKNQEL